MIRNFKINNLPKNCVPVPYRCVVLAPTYNGKSPYHFEFVNRNKRYISEWQGVNCPYVNYSVPSSQPYKELPKMFQIYDYTHDIGLFERDKVKFIMPLC